MLWHFCQKFGNKDTSFRSICQESREDFILFSGFFHLANGALWLEKFAAEPGRRYAFVFGNEVEGEQQAVVDAFDFTLEIPQYGTKHSLNVSVSVGVVLWQWRSRRG